ncbi:outer membrane beta-barrel protein [Helicobacter pylori]
MYKTTKSLKFGTNTKSLLSKKNLFRCGLRYYGTINTNYYSFMGAKLEYRRMYSLFLNYVFAY